MRRKMTKGIAVILCLVLVMALFAGCGSKDGGQEAVTIKIANMYADDSYEAQSMYKFKEIVESKTDSIKVEVYTNAVLGSEETINDSVKSGTIELGVVGSSLSAYLPLFAMGEYPYLFNDYKEAKAVMSDEQFIEMTTGAAEESGFVFLHYSPAGFRQITANKPINSLADLKGFRLRVPNIPIYLDWADGIGVNAIAMSLSELFTALEQGVADGQENPYNVIIANKFYEVQPYVVESRHMMTTHGWIANPTWWNGMDDETKTLIEESIAEAIDYCWQITEEGEANEADTLRDKGVEVIIPDEQFKQEMRDSQKALKKRYIAEHEGSDAVFARVEEVIAAL